MSTESAIQLPAGYTLIDGDGTWNYGYVSGKGIWTQTDITTSPLYFMPDYQLSAYLYQDSNDQLWKWKDEDGRTQNGFLMTPIADAHMPDSGMSRRHTHFNTVTNKWELANISNEVHIHIEHEHDNDVASAVQNHAQWKMMERLTLKAYPDSGAKRAENRNIRTQFYQNWDAASDPDSCILQADAWRKSLGKVEHPENTNTLGRTALANAMTMCGALNSRNLGTPKVKYIDAFIENLIADGALAHDSSERTYPRGVILVKELSEPANNLERTVESVIQGIETELGVSAE